MTKSRNLTLALIVIAFAQLMVVLDTTIVNVALTAGFMMAFEIGGVIALAGFVLALLVMQVRAPKQAAASLAEAA